MDFFDLFLLIITAAICLMVVPFVSMPLSAPLVILTILYILSIE